MRIGKYIGISLGVATGLSLSYYLIFILPNQLVYRQNQRIQSTIQNELSSLQQVQIGFQQLQSLDPESASFTTGRVKIMDSIQKGITNYQKALEKNQLSGTKRAQLSALRQRGKKIIDSQTKEFQIISEIDKDVLRLYDYDPSTDLDPSMPEQMSSRLAAAAKGLKNIAGKVEAEALKVPIEVSANSLQDLSRKSGTDPAGSREAAIAQIVQLKATVYAIEIQSISNASLDETANIIRHYERLTR